MPEAEAALADLTKRWPKLPEDLQGWQKKSHPDLVPAVTGRTGSRPPNRLTTSPPSRRCRGPPEIKRDGKEFYVGFWDTQMHEIRQRFEELLDDHPAVTVDDGDREWLTATIDAPDPEALIAKLWARAQKAPGS